MKGSELRGKGETEAGWVLGNRLTTALRGKVFWGHDRPSEVSFWRTALPRDQALR